MILLDLLSLNQLADYVFIGGTVVFFVMFVGMLGTLGRIKRDVREIKRREENSQNILLSQVRVLKQIRDSHQRY